MRINDKACICSGSAYYTFDSCILKNRISYLRAHLPENVSLCYAIKANPFIVKEIDKQIDSFEICSPGEAYICDLHEISSEKMVISGIFKTPAFIESLISDSSFSGIFTVESLTQFDMMCGLSEKYGREIRLILRLTNDSQFGMDKTDIEGIIRQRCEHSLINIIGVQFFSGTQKTSIKRLKREIDQLDGFLSGLRDDYGYNAEILEYGPGLPVSYFVTDNFDEETYLREFAEMLSNMSFKTGIVLELGRSIAACCGKYYTHIVDIKKNKGTNYIIVDGGMHHLVYFGQQMAMKHPKMSVVGKTDSINDGLWTICGSLCSMNDIIVKQISLPDVEIGDTICFENTGAYCMTEGISLFLSRDLPAVYIKRESGEIICARDTFETYKLNMQKRRPAMKSQA